jgi:hypothetical protein
VHDNTGGGRQRRHSIIGDADLKQNKTIMKGAIIENSQSILETGQS